MLEDLPKSKSVHSKVTKEDLPNLAMESLAYVAGLAA